MGAASMRRPHATLRKALNDAVTKAKLIPTNPALGVALEPAKRHKARVWTAKATRRWQATGERPSPVMVRMPGQAGQFLDHAQAHDITRALQRSAWTTQPRHPERVPRPVERIPAVA